MTLTEYLLSLDWSVAQLARQAGIDTGTAHKAVKGEPITLRSANKILKALSTSLGRKVVLSDVNGLNVGSGTGADWRTIINKRGDTDNGN